MKIKKINKNFNYKNCFKVIKLGIYTFTTFVSISVISKINTHYNEPCIGKELTVSNDNEKDLAISNMNEKEIITESINTKTYTIAEVITEPVHNTVKESEVLKDLLKTEKENNKKIVAITFDDGPGKYTDRLLDILEENDVHATFFVVGYNIDKYADTLVRAYENGNSIAIHSNTHTSFKDMSIDEIQEEIDIVNNKLLDLDITPSSLVRPPYGSINNNIKSNIDYPFILWSVDTLDWKSKNKDKIIEEINNSIENGSIILMHDIHETTIDAVEEILPQLTDEYEFVTIEELFRRNEQELENNTSYRKVKVLEKAD